MNHDQLIRRWAPTLAIGVPTPDLATDQQPSPTPPDPAPEYGVMVAFFLDPTAAAALAQDDGEEPGELHLTLAYLGNVGDQIDAGDENRLIDTVAGWAATTTTMSAQVSGVGIFADAGVTYASIDAPALPQARQDLIAALTQAGFTPNTQHGYTPHVTLAYDARPHVQVPAHDLTFTDVVVAFAGQRTSIRLGAVRALRTLIDSQAEKVALALAAGPPVPDVEPASATLTLTDRPTGPDDPSAPVDTDTVRAFVADVNGHTLITAPVTTAAFKDPTVEDITASHLLWLHGNFVGSTDPNRNGAMWSAGDLQLGRASVVNGPLNWLHEARHVIGTLAEADYVDTGAVQHADTMAPHITTSAAIWKWLYPDEAYVVQQASDQGACWFSMECISKEVGCTGPDGCGNITSYGDYMAGNACAHVTQRASIRQFIDPVFLGGAVIVPPTRPGWAQADARVMDRASKMAEAAFDQAGRPDVSAGDWEQLMAQVLRFGD